MNDLILRTYLNYQQPHNLKYAFLHICTGTRNYFVSPVKTKMKNIIKFSIHLLKIIRVSHVSVKFFLN